VVEIEHASFFFSLLPAAILRAERIERAAALKIIFSNAG
jgi:hypothetical protein